MTARSLALLAALAVVSSACRTDAPAPDATRTFADDVGRTVEVPAEPRRVVPLAPSLTEMVAAAGGLDRLTARTPYCDHPPEAEALPVISTYPLDRERLVALGADLVVGTDQVNDPGEGDALGALGVPAVYLSFGALADIPRGLRRLGDLLGTGDAAEAAAQQFEARIAGRERAGPDAPRVLVLIGDDVLYAFGAASYVHDMVALAGGRSATTAFPGEGATLSSEWVLDASPDVVVVLRDAYGPDDLRAAQPAWDGALPALADGRVCGVDPDLVSRPGPRLADGVAALAACLDRVGAPAEPPQAGS
ncbi:MAG: helical backbone metal receptor [Bacteroidota bacterium]